MSAIPSIQPDSVSPMPQIRKETRYYVVEDGVPLPNRRSLVQTIESLSDGQSFVVPSSIERMRALGLARTRKIRLLSEKLKPSEGSGYRVWRQGGELKKPKSAV